MHTLSAVDAKESGARIQATEKIARDADRAGERLLLVGIDGFVGLTAVAGGVGLLTRMLAPPTERLRHALFRNYDVPGVALLVIVRGGGLLAAITTVTHPSVGRVLSLLAGLAVMGFEVVELIAVSEGSWLQYFYLAVGATIIALALRQPGRDSSRDGER